MKNICLILLALTLWILILSSRTIVIENEKIRSHLFLATITGYSELDSCHYENCIMASGKRAYIGAVACPRYIKLSTRVFIDGTPYICEDRYSKSLSDRFDIFFGYGQHAYRQAKQFGVQEKKIRME